MEDFLQQIDAYSIFATILSFILATVIPFLSYKYRKILCILRECKKTLLDVKKAWEDRDISNEEVKIIFEDLSAILREIKR